MFVFLFLLTFAFQGFAQDYRTHKVKDGDTVYNLAKKYNTTEEAIYELNPSAKQSIQLGQVLVIPPKKIGSSENKKPLRFETYLVQPKETIFGISQQYAIDMADLKKYNPYLYKEELGIGDTLQIPVYTKGKPQPINYNESIQNSSFGNLKHVVLPKETKYGIAEKYGMEVQDLKALNPSMGVLQPGQVLTIRRSSSKPTPIIKDENRYTIYVVQAYDEGSPETIYSLTRKFGISRDSLYALNPNLKKDGLEAGMKLKVPKTNSNSGEYATLSPEITDLEKHLKNFETKELVVMLPFKLNEIGSDSLQNQREFLKNERIARISLDFHSGVLMAMEAAKNKGISVNLRVFDTEQSKNKVNQIISTNNFNNVHAVIGPLLGEMLESTAQQLARKEIPVFSPLTKMEMTAYDNLFQTRPTDELLQNTIITYLDSLHTNENIVILTDGKHVGIKNKLLQQFPNARVFQVNMSAKDDYLKKSEVAAKLSKTAENWVIVESENISLLSMATSYLNLLQPEYKVHLFTTNRNNAYESDEISNLNLSKLNFTFPAFTREFNLERAADFIKKYKEKYGIKPSKFAVRGYDLTYDILLRLASSKDIYDSLKNNWTTEYVENKFHYKEKELGGYQNNAVYILQYGKDLALKPITP
ncbi:MAG TPA: LysM peptidoglycan-binding domain-containing protein [Flavobacteriaceae bacterium]|nr:LysM peptidoglycan-binding domain-containing protein [Flavobacteriaceae bacterium]